MPGSTAGNIGPACRAPASVPFGRAARQRSAMPAGWLAHRLHVPRYRMEYGSSLGRSMRCWWSRRMARICPTLVASRASWSWLSLSQSCTLSSSVSKRTPRSIVSASALALPLSCAAASVNAAALFR